MGHTSSLHLCSLFRHRSVQVMSVMALYLFFGHWMPLQVGQFFYSVSLSIKEVLLWLMPLTVGCFIASTICTFQRQAPMFILSIILFEACSNFISVWYAFGASRLFSFDLSQYQSLPGLEIFSPLWSLATERPGWWSADKGTLIGLIIGCCAAMTKNLYLQSCIHRGRRLAEIILKNVFSRLIPLFVLGFGAKMYHTGFLYQMGHQGLWILSVLVLILFTYILGIFFLANGGSLVNSVHSIKHLLPAGSFALISGCSLSTMPLTIEGTGKNLKDPSFAAAVIPATTNIQQIGDCVANSFLCFLLYRTFFGSNPNFTAWLFFSGAFVIARFATAAVIGGAIFVMLPVYEKYLDFNGDMIAIVLAFNVLLDPIITACNVVANGGLCQLFEKIWAKIRRGILQAEHT